MNAATRLFLSSACLIPLVFLASCKDITQIQTGYVANRDDCRERAQNRLGLYNQPDTYPMSDKEKNNALIALFNECMKEYGWDLGGPKKELKEASPIPTPAPTNQPSTVVVVQSPPAAGQGNTAVIMPPAPVPAPVIAPPAPTPVPVAEACAVPPRAVKGHKPHHHAAGATPTTCQAPVSSVPQTSTPAPVPPDAATQLDSILNKP